VTEWLTSVPVKSSPVWFAWRLLTERPGGLKAKFVSEGVTVKLPACASPVKV
jgi:hypothetical protein